MIDCISWGRDGSEEYMEMRPTEKVSTCLFLPTLLINFNGCECFIFALVLFYLLLLFFWHFCFSYILVELIVAIIFRISLFS